MSIDELSEALGGIYGGFSCEIERVINAFEEILDELEETKHEKQMIEQEFLEYKQYVLDNYEKVPVSHQVNVFDDDFV